jgi:hypothetical protein
MYLYKWDRVKIILFSLNVNLNCRAKRCFAQDHVLRRLVIITADHKLILLYPQSSVFELIPEVHFLLCARKYSFVSVVLL